MPTTAIDDGKSVVPNAGRKASGHYITTPFAWPTLHQRLTHQRCSAWRM